MSETVAPSIWDRERIGVTVGAIALIFLGAIEALAVTTVMPVVSAALGDEALYAVAFAATLATSVIGMVACGAWSGRVRGGVGGAGDGGAFPRRRCGRVPRLALGLSRSRRPHRDRVRVDRFPALSARPRRW